MFSPDTNWNTKLREVYSNDDRPSVYVDRTKGLSSLVSSLRKLDTLEVTEKTNKQTEKLYIVIFSKFK